ncbi:hypothetical protein SAMN02799627_04720 [Methylobacterium sp. 13MFTsu3.1M2]|nr:hypothetical protein SAMN02799627_04720 [Methylobacterium sp. 13MFTsu3.1M2]
MVLINLRMITPDELDALLAHIAALEMTIQEQAAQIDRLTIQREGVKAVTPTTPAPVGFAYGNAGQLVLADREEIYRRMREGWPSAPTRRF